MTIRGREVPLNAPAAGSGCSGSPFAWVAACSWSATRFDARAVQPRGHGVASCPSRPGRSRRRQPAPRSPCSRCSRRWPCGGDAGRGDDELPALADPLPGRDRDHDRAAVPGDHPHVRLRRDLLEDVPAVVMRRPAAILALVLVTGLAVRRLAAAQPPAAIVRPDDEAGLSQRELGAAAVRRQLLELPRRSTGAGSSRRRRSGRRRHRRGRALRCAASARRPPTSTCARATCRSRDPDEQPARRRVLFSDREIRALVAYVASLGKGPPVPRRAPERRAASREGLQLFTEHCAGCHQVVAQGGVVTGAARAAARRTRRPTQIAEAVRIGPYLMPRFSKRQISDRQLDSIVRYVRSTAAPARPRRLGDRQPRAVPRGDGDVAARRDRARRRLHRDRERGCGQ